MHPHSDQIRLVLCSTCQSHATTKEQIESVQEALCQAGLQSHVELAEHPCLNACGAPVTIGLQGTGRATYVFSDVEPVTDAADIAATCQSYLDSPKGWIEDARSCGRLRLCLKVRLPAL